ncbi:EAL domain-containing protein [Trinickia terrae]|uniref:EAL domain-containing protein n=1 Tax=Trinickia terrae TaxID=2571161 RepID=A0A4U1I1C6_9BURK|nr:EAL domain-containing protein [Trinickia terrae]TKC86928.1 EAL domain-containing protein [Trinickia terrae]
MRLHKLRSKIALVFVLLMLAVQAAVFIAADRVIASVARAHVDEQLDVGERVFRRVLQSDTARLTQAAGIVAADFGFREAVATGDEATVMSALRNQGDRIRADVAMLVNLEGKLIADSRTPSGVGSPFAFPALLEHPARKDAATLIGSIGGKAYALVVVPVKAPTTIAWVAIGFSIDDAFAAQMHDVTSLDVSFMTRVSGNRWTIAASSLPGEERGALQRASGGAMFADRHDTSLQLNDGFGSRAVWLAPYGEPVVAVLQKSIAEAIARFRQLQVALLLLTLAGVAVSIAGATLTARSVTRPLAELTRFARRIGRGEYDASISISQKDEISELAAAFSQMRNDIAEREARITNLAYVDTLTALPNRLAFCERLEEAIDRSGREAGSLAVMVMDIDRFKYVNDALGHHAGDMLLREVGKRLRQALPHASDLVARLGGDEFAMLLPHSGPDAAQRVANACLKALEAPIQIEEHFVDVGASLGIACFPQHGADMPTLLRRADAAMYVAKRANTGVAMYDASRERGGAERLSLMSELRHAIDHGELRLYYQPKVDLATNAMAHVEALVRWVHPARGMVPPGEFIPFAEQTGFIRSISRWVAGEAIAQCARWHALGLELNVSINLSARDLGADLPDALDALLRRHGLDARWLWVEITESALMDDPAHAIDTLERLHRLGIRLSIDDFGTGYSSLAYLKRMPVSELKIDRSFVMGMTGDADDELIVRSTIALAHNMGLQVAAEGIEDEATLARLRALHCDIAQGYYLSRPLPADKVEGWLREWNEVVAACSQTQSG